jgi:hypothetical protein
VLEAPHADPIPYFKKDHKPLKDFQVESTVMDLIELDIMEKKIYIQFKNARPF